MWIMLALLPDSLSNALVNTNTQLLAPTIRGTNIYANNLPSLIKESRGQFEYSLSTKRTLDWTLSLTQSRETI